MPTVHQACAGPDQPGGASTAEVLTLARTVRDGVRAAFGVTLVPEPVLVGCPFESFFPERAFSPKLVGVNFPSGSDGGPRFTRRRALTAAALGLFFRCRGWLPARIGRQQICGTREADPDAHAGGRVRRSGTDRVCRCAGQ